jgi:hypothetical protein
MSDQQKPTKAKVKIKLTVEAEYEIDLKYYMDKTIEEAYQADMACYRDNHDLLLAHMTFFEKRDASFESSMEPVVPADKEA